MFYYVKTHLQSCSGWGLDMSYSFEEMYYASFRVFFNLKESIPLEVIPKAAKENIRE